jgi:cytochrome c oxidase cbb3-type subunit 3
MTSVRYQIPSPRRALALSVLVALAACGKESRVVGAEPPQTPPIARDDPRVPTYQGNVYQVAQGGRYFTWYGCGACHGLEAKRAPSFTDGRWRHGDAFEQVYAFIDHGHGGLPVADGRTIPVEQLWQITTYVRDLALQTPEKRHRQDVDQQGEPQGKTWTGAVR